MSLAVVDCFGDHAEETLRVSFKRIRLATSKGKQGVRREVNPAARFMAVRVGNIVYGVCGDGPGHQVSSPTSKLA